MASSSSALPPGTCVCISQLLLRVSKLRKKELTIDPDDFTVVTPADKHIWAKMFVEYFLSDINCSLAGCSAQSDDMLWYVRYAQQGFFIGPSASGGLLDVHRRQSKRQPVPGDLGVNWEETLYLNLLLQHIEYSVTVAVCTKTSPHNLQILRKNSQRVFASPSRRRMDSKGEGEEMAYPNIYFAIDNFEETFGDVVVRDGECVCVELVARDRYGSHESAVFLGSIRYEVLKQVYDTRASNSWLQKMLPSGERRQEFVRMRGPHGKGFAEMAVTRVPGCGFETPTAEELPFEDFEVQAVESYRRRRMSENNLAAENYYRFKGSPMRKAASEADYAEQCPEVEAQSLDEELEEGVFGRLWGMRGFGQAWHWLREKRRAASTPLHAFLTYVTLPWHSIVADLLESPRRPVLYFDLPSAPPLPTPSTASADPASQPSSSSSRPPQH